MFRYILFGILGGIFSFLGYIVVWISQIDNLGSQVIDTYFWLLFAAYLGVIFFLVYKLTQDRGEEFSYVLVLPVFILLGLYTIIEVVSYGLLRWPPDSEAFTAECSKAEAKYIKSPATPVRSIAFDWDSEEVPSFIDFQIQFGTRVSDLRQSNQPEVNMQHFDFVETNHTPSTESRCLSSGFKYLRYPKNADCYGASQLAADILVKYKTSPIDQSRKDGALRYELTVSDRRNGDKLAYLRYVVDVKKQRACGLTGTGRVNDGQFIQKAIGL